MEYKCECGKIYTCMPNLSRHGKTCDIYQTRKILKQPTNIKSDKLPKIPTVQTTTIDLTSKNQSLAYQIAELEFNKNNLSIQIEKLNKIIEKNNNKISMQIEEQKNQTLMLNAIEKKIEKTVIRENQEIDKIVSKLTYNIFKRVIEKHANFEFTFHKELIYLIREREFVVTNQNIFKIGMSAAAKDQRINSYPKNSELYIVMRSEDAKNDEKAILGKFHKKFEHMGTIGSEYFMGNPKYMIEIIQKICNL